MINEKLLNYKDYIVEQGTNGIWEYRKWNSGIAECWFSVSQLHTFSGSDVKSWGSVYEGPSTYYTYPSGLFIQEPTNIIQKAGGAGGWLEVGGGASAIRTSSVYPIYPASKSGTVNCYIGVYAIGRWK